MGLSYRAYLEGTSSIIYGCSKCQTHLSTSDSIISRVKIMLYPEVVTTLVVLTLFYNSNFKVNMVKHFYLIKRKEI
jgi:hypothetical protein